MVSQQPKIDVRDWQPDIGSHAAWRRNTRRIRSDLKLFAATMPLPGKTKLLQTGSLLSPRRDPIAGAGRSGRLNGSGEVFLW